MAVSSIVSSYLCTVLYLLSMKDSHSVYSRAELSEAPYGTVGLIWMKVWLRETAPRLRPTIPDICCDGGERKESSLSEKPDRRSQRRNDETPKTGFPTVRRAIEEAFV